MISGLERLGVHVMPLGTEELIELYYNFYNPIARESIPHGMPEDIKL
mgnify:CR=1 FL=1